MPFTSGYTALPMVTASLEKPASLTMMLTWMPGRASGKGVMVRKGEGDAGTGPPDVEEGLLSEILSSLRVKSADEEWKAGEERSWYRGVRHGVSREEMLQQVLS